MNYYIAIICGIILDFSSKLHNSCKYNHQGHNGKEIDYNPHPQQYMIPVAAHSLREVTRSSSHWRNWYSHLSRELELNA